MLLVELSDKGINLSHTGVVAVQEGIPAICTLLTLLFLWRLNEFSELRPADEAVTIGIDPCKAPVEFLARQPAVTVLIKLIKVEI